MLSTEATTRLITKLYKKASKDINAELLSASDFRRSQIVLIQQNVDNRLRQLLSETAKVVNERYPRHYMDGWNFASKQIQKVDANSFVQINDDAIRVLVDEILTLFGQATQGASRTASVILSTASQEQITEIIAEGFINQQGIRELRSQVREAVESGYTAIIDASGKQWAMDTYANMLTRTTANRAINTAFEQRMLASGYDLVQVSDHNGKYPCSEWENKVLSLTGKTPGYPTIDQAKASPQKLFRPNCTHRYLPYFPDIEGEATKSQRTAP